MSNTGQFARQLTVLFDDDTKRKLEALTDNGRLTQAHVIRQAIQRTYSMEVEQRPTCANGSQCHCPHTHTFIPRQQVAGG